VYSSVPGGGLDFEMCRQVLCNPEKRYCTQDGNKGECERPGRGLRWKEK